MLKLNSLARLFFQKKLNPFSSLKTSRSKTSMAFTIVELLIVIVVIAILAAIMIVAYNGIQKSAGRASVRSDVANITRQLEIFMVDTDSYPTAVDDCPEPSGTAICVNASNGNAIHYASFKASTGASRRILASAYELRVMRDDSFLYTSTIEATNDREFVRYADLAPILDKYGLVNYKLSFDIKSADTSSQSTVRLYFQNGTGARYSITGQAIPVSTEYSRHDTTFKPNLIEPSTAESWLSFYGTYNTGNIPTIKNVTLELAD